MVSRINNLGVPFPERLIFNNDYKGIENDESFNGPQHFQIAYGHAGYFVRHDKRFDWLVNFFCRAGYDWKRTKYVIVEYHLINGWLHSTYAHHWQGVNQSRFAMGK